MQEIPLQSIPNQRVQVRLGRSTYGITVCTRRGALYATVSVNDVIVVRNRVMRSFAPFEGNLMIVDNVGVTDPDWRELGSRYRLFWWQMDE